MSRDKRIDFSSLEPNPAGEQWESRIREIANQAQLLRQQRERGEQLETLDVFASERVFEQKIENILRATRGGDSLAVSPALQVQNQVTKVGPRALALGAMLAAAAWFGVLFFDPPNAVPRSALTSPGLDLATWAEHGQVPQTEDILMVMEESHVDR